MQTNMKTMCGHITVQIDKINFNASKYRQNFTSASKTVTQHLSADADTKKGRNVEITEC